MAIKKKATPLLKMRGRYTLVMPWVANPTTLYTCKGLRTFSELVDSGEDIYSKYYLPKNLTEADFKEDWDNDATLAILNGDNGEIIYVPDTYIVSYPTMEAPSYGHLVFSGSFGPMRLDLNLDFFVSKMKEVASDVIGLEPEIYIEILDGNTVLSQQDADALEAARLNAIKIRTTTYAELLELRDRYAVAQQQIEDLQSLLPQTP